ncbi:hypothetical protein PFISCL1PPCAC_25438, partial [Pristionchus fissidentatus]
FSTTHPMRSAILLLLLCSITIQSGWCLDRYLDNGSTLPATISSNSPNEMFDDLNTLFPTSSFYDRTGNVSKYLNNNSSEFLRRNRRKRSLEDDYAKLLAEQKEYKADFAVAFKVYEESAKILDQARGTLTLAIKTAETLNEKHEKAVEADGIAIQVHGIAVSSEETAKIKSKDANTTHEAAEKELTRLNGVTDEKKGERDAQQLVVNGKERDFNTAKTDSSAKNGTRDSTLKVWDNLKDYLSGNTTAKTTAEKEMEKIDKEIKAYNDRKAEFEKKKSEAKAKISGLSQAVETAKGEEKSKKDR